MKILKQANFLPEEIRWRKQIDELRSRMHEVRSEKELRKVVREMNDLICRLNTMGTNKIPTALTTFDEEKVVGQWRARRSSEPDL